jgi:acyl carrier protein
MDSIENAMDIIRNALLSYLADNFDVDMEDIEDDTPLFSSSLLDSFGMIDLVGFIEIEAAVKFGALDMHLDNLDSVRQILAFVETKRA